MAEIADDKLSGTVCSECGVFFKNGYVHGYPVLCHDCWDDLSEKEQDSSPPRSIKPDLE